MINPQLGPEYYNEEHRDILKKYESFYSSAITINQAFWGEADVDHRYYAGDQTLYNEIYGNLPINKRPTFVFNRIRRIINMIGGHQRRNRKSIISVPVENGDELTADQYTKILFWLDQQEGVLNTISDAFEGALIGGMNLLQVWVDYRNDPISGDIKIDNCSYNSFLIDPYFRKTDLSDCNAVAKRTYLSKRDLMSLLPDKEEEIMQMQTNIGYAKDGKFQFMPENYSYTYSNLLAYDEFYYRSYRKQKVLVDTETGESMEWKYDNDDALRQFLNTYPQVTLLDQEIPTVRLAIIVQNKVIDDGPNPLGVDVYPFVPVFSYYQPEVPYYPQRIQGVVRGLRDAQFLYNRRRQIELDILESQVNSGWIYKENALVNPKDVFLSGQGRGLALKEEANMADVQRIEAPQVPPSMIELSKLLAQEVQEISGVSEELLGFDNKDTLSGFHAMLKQSASTITLQKLFDQLDNSMKVLGKVILQVIQNNFTPGKVKRIIEEEPAPQFYNKAFGKYDVAIEEGLNTTTQRQMQFAQLLQLKEVGVPVPDDILLDAVTIQNKKELRDRIMQANQQQQQMQEQQAQVQMQEIQARTELAKSRSMADQGLAVERTSRVEENRALAIERIAEANKDDELATLNKIKAIKELDQIDLNQIQALLNLVNILKGQEQQQAQQQQPEEIT